MGDAAANAERVIAAYNAKDFDAMEALIAAKLDFAHFNRGFVLNDRTEFLAILSQFAGEFLSARHFEPPLRVTASGNVCVRESYWVATPKVPLPAFGAAAGETIRLKFVTVMRFDDQGILVEWKDYG